MRSIDLKSISFSYDLSCNDLSWVLLRYSVRYEEVIRKQGLRHTRLETTTGAEREVFLLGGACSEVFSGPRLAKVLTPAFELQKQAMDALAAGRPAPTLSNHTCNQCIC